jgi:hypothetical protein
MGVAMDIVFGNVTEAFLDILLAALPQPGGADRVRLEAALSQRALFWLSDNKIVVTHIALPDILLRHCKRVTGWSNILNWVPRGADLDLCAAVLADAVLFSRLVEVLHVNPQSRITAYAATQSLARLVLALRSAGCQFTTLENLSQEGLKLQAYLDTKAGFRTEANKLTSFGGITIPEGFICGDSLVAEQAICWFINQSKGCVVKSNRGESGWGTLILKHNQSNDLIRSIFRHQIAVDAIWRQVPYIVEEYIRPGDHPILSPSVEFFVSDLAVEITYSCAQAVGVGGDFRGVHLGPGCVTTTVKKRIEKAGHALGEHYQNLGYRGYFDADYVVRDDGDIFMLETNMRRTGGTHIYDLSRSLGLPIESNHYFSEDSVRSPAALTSAETLLTDLGDLLYDPRGRSDGVVLTILDDLSHTFGYVAIGKTLHDVLDLKLQIRNIIDAYER